MGSTISRVCGDNNNWLESSLNYDATTENKNYRLHNKANYCLWELHLHDYWIHCLLLLLLLYYSNDVCCIVVYLYNLTGVGPGACRCWLRCADGSRPFDLTFAVLCKTCAAGRESNRPPGSRNLRQWMPLSFGQSQRPVPIGLVPRLIWWYPGVTN